MLKEINTHKMCILAQNHPKISLKMIEFVRCFYELLTVNDIPQDDLRLMDYSSADC